MARPKKQVKKEDSQFFGTFEFGQKHAINGQPVKAWKYYVGINANTKEEAVRLMWLNYGRKFASVYSAEVFEKSSDFYPGGLLKTITDPGDQFYLLNATVGFECVRKKTEVIPSNWYRSIEWVGTLADLCNAANELEGAVVSDGKFVLWNLYDSKNRVWRIPENLAM